ncbi:filamentous hemagglutinin N-terminal domain-containing protein, partial [Erwinia sp.]|uniref:two-partner secretion domain-containing protein n=1 Tax=Erwinia citreus TaxID=558 RepID=UPI003C776609
MDDRQPVSFFRRALSYLICGLIATQPLLPAFAAQVTPVTPGTKMDAAGNGVPVVNITTPNQAGISHNQYQQYNVGKEGLILNNGTNRLTQTQLGGLIQNNPNLKAGQEAKAIINEVVGANRSQLQGYTEVAGKAANVMVANPYGITCNGCGFINTPNVTLTTGKPQFDAQGNLKSLDVTKGAITIEGKGLDGSQSDAVSIISRATEINAGIYAKDLSVTLGANRVGQDGSVTPIAGEGAAPSIAVDTGALGGMYANRIHLVSSEKGVGVNLGNLNARQGDMVLDASGRLVVNDSLTSGTVTIKGDGVALNGDHKAGGSLTVQSQQDISLQNGALVTDGTLAITGKRNLTSTSTTMTAGRDIQLNGAALSIDKESSVNAGTDIHLGAQKQLVNAGQVIAARNLAIKAGETKNSGLLSAKAAQTLNSESVTNNGKLVGNTLNLNTQSLINSGEVLGGEFAEIRAERLENSSKATITGAGNLQITSTDLINQGSILAPELTLNGSQIDNAGLLQGNKNLNLSGNLLNNRASGTISSDESFTLNLPELNNSGLIHSGADLSLKGETLVNAGEINATNLKADTTSLTNQQSGLLLADKNMQLLQQQLSNDGQIAADELDIHAAQFTNRGISQSNTALHASGDNVINNGTLLSAGVLTVDASGLTNNGLIQGRNLDVQADKLLNSGDLLSEGAAQLQANQLQNSGKVLSQQSVSLKTGSTENQGQLMARVLELQGDLINIGTLGAEQLTLSGNVLQNGGLIQGDTALTADYQQMKNQVSGKMLSGGELKLHGENASNEGTWQAEKLGFIFDALENSGTLISTGQLEGTLQGQLKNDGILLSSGNTTLQTASLINNGKISADGLVLRSKTVNNSGLLQGSSSLDAQAENLTTTTGSKTLTAGKLTLNATQLTTDGTLQGEQAVINTDDWQHQGSLLSSHNLQVTVGGELRNEGELLSQGDASIGARTLNNLGSLLSEQAMTLTGDELNNSGTVQGKILTITPATVINQGNLTGLQALTLGALPRAAGRMMLMALTIPPRTLTNNAGGALLTQGTLTVNGGVVTNNGSWQGAKILLDAQRLTNNGAIQSAGDMQLLLSDRLDSGVGSKISAGGLTVLQAMSLANQGQWIAQNLMLNGGTLDNKGEISGVTGLTVQLSGALTQQQNKTLLTAGKLQVQASSLSNAGRIQGNELEITSGAIDNSGLLQGNNTLLLTASGRLTNNSAGTLMTQSTLTLTTPELYNYGLIQAGGTSNVKATGAMKNAGRLLSGGELTLNTPQLTNSGWLQASRLILNATNTDNSGTLLADQQGTLTGNSFTTQGTVQGGNLAVNYQQLTNSGTVMGVSQLKVKASQVIQQAAGRLFSGGDLSLESNGFNQAGQVVALGSATLQLINSFTARGTLAAGNRLSISSNSALDNQGTLQGNAMTLSAGGNLTNNGQLTTGNGDSSLTGNRISLNASGTLQGGGNINIVSRTDIAVDGFTGTRGSLVLSAPGNIVNSALLYAANNLYLYANSIKNQRGDILAGNSLWMQRDSAGNANGEVINTSGTIETQNGDITVNTGHLLNTRDGLHVTQTSSSS